MSALSSSLKRLGVRLLVLQIFGTAGILLAAALWLEIPDSHVWELLVSLLLGAVILVSLLALQAIVMRTLRAAQNQCALWLGAALLAVWAVLLYLPTMLVDVVGAASYQRASYWNSQLSPGLRAIFTYQRLSTGQFAAFDLVVWFLVPALLLPFIVETVACGVRGGTWRAGVRLLGRWRYWVSCILVGVVLHFVVSPLVDWQPAHSVRGEVVSVVLRLGVVYLVVVLLLTLLVAVTASLLARGDSVGDTVL